MAVAFVLFWEPVAIGLGEWLEPQTSLQDADLVVALGGDRVRQDAAVALLRSGHAKWIMFVGGDVRPHDYTCLDVPSERILAQPPPVYTTMEEARIVRQVIGEYRLRSLIIVTSPYHFRRTLWTFRRVFGKSDVALLTAPAPNPVFSSHDWWKTHLGRKQVILEYVALVYYLFTVRSRLTQEEPTIIDA